MPISRAVRLVAEGWGRLVHLLYSIIHVPCLCVHCVDSGPILVLVDGIQTSSYLEYYLDGVGGGAEQTKVLQI